MGDKVDELFEIIGNNKKSLIYMLIIYGVVALAIIAIIWWPKEKKYATYETVDIDTRKSQEAQNYINKISNILKNNDTVKLNNLISNRFVEYTGKGKEQILNELKEMGFLSNDVEVRGVNVYTDGDTYVYSTTMYSGENSKIINIIERYPYDYEIVFDDFYSYEKKRTAYTNESIKFTIDNVYRNLKYIEFNMRIENLNSSYARFDFNSTVGVQAVLEDGTSYPLANLVSYEEYTNVEANMTINKNFVFEIPAQLQEGIKYIVFNGVRLEFSTKNIKVNI